MCVIGMWSWLGLMNSITSQERENNRLRWIKYQLKYAVKVSKPSQQRFKRILSFLPQTQDLILRIEDLQQRVNKKLCQVFYVRALMWNEWGSGTWNGNNGGGWTRWFEHPRSWFHWTLQVGKSGSLTSGWRKEASPLLEILQRPHLRDFPGGPGVKNLPSNTGDVGSILGRGSEIPPAAVQPLILGMVTGEKPLCYNIEPMHPIKRYHVPELRLNEAKNKQINFKKRTDLKQLPHGWVSSSGSAPLPSLPKDLANMYWQEIGSYIQGWVLRPLG